MQHMRCCSERKLSGLARSNSVAKTITPELFVPDASITSSIRLDESASMVAGYFSAIPPDGASSRWGRRLTEALLVLHKHELRSQEQEWGGDYSFTVPAVMRWSEELKLNAGFVEAVRRGWVPWARLSDEDREMLETLISAVQSQVRTPGTL